MRLKKDLTFWRFDFVDDVVDVLEMADVDAVRDDDGDDEIGCVVVVAGMSMIDDSMLLRLDATLSSMSNVFECAIVSLCCAMLLSG